MSISWGTSEFPFLEDLIAMVADAKIAVCVASGDNGSTFPDSGELVVFYPSSSPNVISIGGTKLILGPNDVRASESDDNRNPDFGSTWGGGGGISQSFLRPSWQDGLFYTPIGDGVMGNPTPLNARGIPDISAPMNVYAYYFNGLVSGAGGTSLAAPMIASILARYQQLTGVQRSSVEYNKIFYANPNAFYDIIVGTNNTEITSGYAGTVGWDPVTGLGPPIGADLYKIIRQGSVFPKQNYGFRPTTGSSYPRRTVGAR
jgi:subtilase family serine protease